MICLDEIVGYMTENATWHMMDFLLNAKLNRTPTHLNPHIIGLENDEFCFLEKNVEISNVEDQNCQNYDNAFQITWINNDFQGKR